MDITFDGWRKVGVAGLAAVAGCVSASGDAEPIVIAVTDDGLRVLTDGEEITLGELIKDPDRRECDQPRDGTTGRLRVRDGPTANHGSLCRGLRRIGGLLDSRVHGRSRRSDPRARLPDPTRQAGTIAPVFRYLIDQAIMYGMDNSNRSAYYLLDEIEHLDATIKRLGELINVGRGVDCQAILSLQSVAQLEDTYGKERAHALLSGMVTVIGLRTADKESVDFLRETIGTSFKQYTRNSGDDRTPSESEEKEEYHFAKDNLRNFDAGEAVICRQGQGWVHGRIKMLEK